MNRYVLKEATHVVSGKDSQISSGFADVVINLFTLTAGKSLGGHRQVFVEASYHAAGTMSDSVWEPSQKSTIRNIIG